jgi:23S rRNA (uracil1939-C5)-methyltransferase
LSVAVHIESLDQEGRGVARVDGKVTFVDGALPGESVEIRTWRRKRSFDLASATRILRASSQRVTPPCPHFERCGGCSLQHLDERAQVAIKQRTLEDNLARLGGVRAEEILPPIHGPAWGYRLRARLAVRQVASKGGVLVGFHERRTHHVLEMDSCAVLPARISGLIVPLRDLLGAMQLAARIPQIEVAAGDAADALVLRVLDPPGARDLGLLRAFAERHGLDIYLQPRGPDSVHPLQPERLRPLFYRLPDFDLTLRFQPTDFTQVNRAVNEVLVRRAVGLLDPHPGQRLADLFCGLGNFTLALARRGAQVLGVEGSMELVARAEENARRNGLAQRARFRAAGLLDAPQRVLAELGPLDGMLVDPPRHGAHGLVQALGEGAPRRLLYVSCNPATLARDAGVLVRDKGYRLRAAGVMNMFPHTSHVESVALFERLGSSPMEKTA